MLAKATGAPGQLQPCRGNMCILPAIICLLFLAPLLRPPRWLMRPNQRTRLLSHMQRALFGPEGSLQANDCHPCLTIYCHHFSGCSGRAICIHTHPCLHPTCVYAVDLKASCLTSVTMQGNTVALLFRCRDGSGRCASFFLASCGSWLIRMKPLQDCLARPLLLPCDHFQD